MGARVSESVTFNIYNAFLVTYTVTVLGLDNSVVLNALLVAVGRRAVRDPRRRPALRPDRPPAGLRRSAPRSRWCRAFPIFALVNTENPLLITIGVVIGWGIAACTMFGPEGALFAEVFPTRVRYSGMSAVYQIGVIPTGAVAPLIGTSLVSAYTGSVWPVAVYVMAMAADHAGVAVLPARDPPARHQRRHARRHPRRRPAAEPRLAATGTR